MTSELRPAVEVWDDAIAAWAADTIDTRQAAAAVIEAYGDEREAKGREEQAAELARLKSLSSDHFRNATRLARELAAANDKAAKYKALAETLAGDLEPFAKEWDEREFLAQRHWSFYREASKAIAEYKEATNV